MSKNIWQIRKQNEQLRYGKSITSRVKAYLTAWESKCYSRGVPDDVPNKLLFSGRAPSYKAIAICILSNDAYLQKLGLSPPPSKSGEEIVRQLKKEIAEEVQLELF